MAKDMTIISAPAAIASVNGSALPGKSSHRGVNTTLADHEVPMGNV